jgi:hypothetical protein
MGRSRVDANGVLARSDFVFLSSENFPAAGRRHHRRAGSMPSQIIFGIARAKEILSGDSKKTGSS